MQYSVFFNGMVRENNIFFATQWAKSPKKQSEGAKSPKKQSEGVCFC